MKYCKNCIFCERKYKDFVYCKNFEKSVGVNDYCRKHIRDKSEQRNLSNEVKK